MIPWVHESCKAWARHRRWLDAQTELGWPSRSMLGKLMDEGPGAGSSGGTFGSSVPISDPPKDYAGISFALQRMISGYALRQQAEVVQVHYLGTGDVKTKAAALEISVSQYWDFLHSAHAYFAGFLDAGEVNSGKN